MTDKSPTMDIFPAPLFLLKLVLEYVCINGRMHVMGGKGATLFISWAQPSLWPCFSSSLSPFPTPRPPSLHQTHYVAQAMWPLSSWPSLSPFPDHWDYRAAMHDIPVYFRQAT